MHEKNVFKFARSKEEKVVERDKKFCLMSFMISILYLMLTLEFDLMTYFN